MSSHAHHHHPSRNDHDKRLAFTLLLTALYMIAECIGAKLTGSLALLADAGHMLSDVAALALSWFAIWFAKKPTTAQKTYGYYRTEILAALLNASALFAVAIYIFVEAYQRTSNPPLINGSWVSLFAGGGLVVNLLGAAILHAGKDSNLNIKGAFMHVLYDALGSVGAIISGALIWAFGWYWVDPMASVLIGLLVVYSAWSLLKETVAILMEAAPMHINVTTVREYILAIDGVHDVHDLHVWTITSGLDSLSAHVVIDNSPTHQQILSKTHAMLEKQFGIKHATLQLEPREFKESHTCAVC
jgi:cobalt-zinc-cadmium efflux system protein